MNELLWCLGFTSVNELGSRIPPSWGIPGKSSGVLEEERSGAASP